MSTEKSEHKSEHRWHSQGVITKATGTSSNKLVLVLYCEYCGEVKVKEI